MIDFALLASLSPANAGGMLGGGTAGLVVAARMDENPNVTVAVIEAGIHHINEPLVDTPGKLDRSLTNCRYERTDAESGKGFSRKHLGILPLTGASPLSHRRG